MMKELVIFVSLILFSLTRGYSQWSSDPDYIEPNNNNFAKTVRAFNGTNFAVFKDGSMNSMRGWDVFGNTVLGFYQEDLHIKSGADTESIRIRVRASDGAVAIGSADPQEKLDVQDGNVRIEHNISAQLILDRGTTGGSGQISFRTKGNNDAAIIKGPSTIQQAMVFAPAGGSIFEASDKMYLGTQGNLGLGVINPSSTLDVAGNVSMTGELTAASDRRLKTNIKPLSAMIDRIMQLNPVSYRFRSDQYASLKLPEEAQIVFIAQEIQDVFPELVQYGQKATSPDGESFNIQTVDYIKLIPALTAALQEMYQTQLELQQQIVVLKHEISTLKQQASR